MIIFFHTSYKRLQNLILREESLIEIKEMERIGGNHLAAAGPILRWGGVLNPELENRRREVGLNYVETWADISIELLEIISRKLSLVDNLKIGRVCKSWRTARAEFITFESPLIVVISERGKRTCFYINIFNGARYKTKLPFFTGKYYLGVSSGYMVMQRRNNTLWFTNPISGHHFEMDRDFQYGQHDVLVAHTSPQKDVLVIAHASRGAHLEFRRTTDADWTAVSYAEKSIYLVDIVIFHKVLYALTADTNIGAVSLKSLGDLDLLEFEDNEDKGTFAFSKKFVASNDELLVIDFEPRANFLKIFKIDFKLKKWVRLRNLGGDAIFCSSLKTSRLSKPARWGMPGNCIYYLECMSNECLLFSLDGRYISSIPFEEGSRISAYRFVHGWYFPDQFTNVDELQMEEVVTPAENTGAA